jgi:hypothetical protein
VKHCARLNSIFTELKQHQQISTHGVSGRDGRAFSLPMQKVDDIPNGDATVYGYTEKQHALLSRREDSSGRQDLDPRLESHPGDDMIRNRN